MENQPTETLCSLADARDAPGVADGEQHLTLFRVGSLLTGAQRDLCLVKKVSNSGALIRAYGKLRRGEKVDLEFKGQNSIEGSVAWASGSEARIIFDQAIDVLRLLKRESGGPPPRMPRIDVRTFARIRQGAVVQRAVVHNISQGGISAQCNADLQVGEDATVTVAGMAPVQGVVRWSGSGGCGITFNTVLGLPLLVEWLHAHTAMQACES